ncbi:MAG: hypothetical protein ACRDJU_01485 [Actinomycetota bacterium]
MASQAEQLSHPVAGGAEEEADMAPTTSTDYPKAVANSALSEESAPVGSRPLSVSEADLPHHPGANPSIPDKPADESQ